MREHLFNTPAWRNADSDSTRRHLLRGITHYANFRINEGSIHVNTTNLSISDVVSLPSNFENTSQQNMMESTITNRSLLALTRPNNSQNIEDGGANLDGPEENHQEDHGFTINDEDVNEPVLTMTEEMIAVIDKHRTPHSALFNARQLAAVELHHMLAHINVPKYLFDKIYKWASHHNIDKPYSQKSLVKDMRNIIQTPDIYPTRISVVIN